ncbi:hypothetical protein DWB61_11775 [Ancylomarina euxinus]|uniref:Uncharacterized protein n=1 Tax=Ancylomarina euxinus TaxID=2283627 RepID=A0A425XZL6_9BACT|nr:hypothetical protein [Ancylomarina euxinus]MCZ4695488.1 hypothetical protein [Ancylomarina euxinus]MUP15694.1 hypothetical protein [Ancylomarina euxinus]RRG20687.1 hypothetical protein DWB61_11775 [Ancylomarina euxinus]
MSDQQELIDIMEEIKVFPREKIKNFTTPISIYLNEADNLHTRANLDLLQLQEVGMSADLLDRLKHLTTALRRAQVNWKELKTEKQKAQSIWKQESKTLYELRKDLLEGMSFAFRKDENLMQHLREIKKGRNQADDIHDLSRLAVLGTRNLHLLEAIHFDISLCDKAAKASSRFAHILGAVNGHLYVEDEIKITRDKAYSLLKEVVDELRAYGRFAFRKKPNQQKSYTSSYIHKRNIMYRKNKKSSLEE